jgi:DNA-binding LacI/PurR family transcriptional regulator
VPEADGAAGARRATLKLLAAEPGLDGLLVPLDAFAAGAMAALRERARRVPEDARVVTRYDGLRARTESPPLTAVDLHLDRVARLAIDRLILGIAGAEALASSARRRLTS